jgi:hypothetical protein
MGSNSSKSLVYFGSLASQLSTLCLLVVVVREASTEAVAMLAIVDGILLFLPFFLSIMCERSAVSIFYEQNKVKGLEAFALGSGIVLIMSLFISAIVLTAKLFIAQDHYHYISLFLFILFSASGSAIFNIQVQKYLVTENYQSLAISQVMRGVLLLLVAYITSRLTDNMVLVYVLSLGVSSYITSSIHLVRAIHMWELKIFISHIGLIIRMGQVSLLVLFFGFLLANLGRYALGASGDVSGLAKLLIYTKTSMLVLSFVAPYSNFLKPKIMSEYSIDRSVITSYWTSLLAVCLFIGMAVITTLNVILKLWGEQEALEVQYSEFSLLLGSGVLMALLGAAVDIFYDHSLYLKNKLLVYGIPLVGLFFLLLYWYPDIDFLLVVVALFITHSSILLMALSLAFGWWVAIYAFGQSIMVCGAFVIWGLMCNWVATDLLDADTFSVLSVTIGCALMACAARVILSK